MQDNPRRVPAHPPALPSSASAPSTCLVIPFDDDEITPTMTRQSPSASTPSLEEEAALRLADRGPEGAESTTRFWTPGDEDEREALIQRVEEAAEVAALNSIRNNRRPAVHFEIDMSASESLAVIEDTEEEIGSSEEDEFLRDENGRRRPNDNNVESTPELLRREFTRLRLALRQNRNAQTVAYMFSAFLPFALLFLFKLCFEKRAAIFSTVVGYIVFLLADKHVTSIASNQRGSIFIALFAIAGHYLSIVYIIGLSLQPILDGLTMQFQMYQNCLVTLYYVIMTDLAAKHLTVTLKGLLVSLPARTMVLKRRRRLSQFLEYGSQMYRAAIAAPWWIMYFFGPSPLTETGEQIHRGSLTENTPFVDLVLAGIYVFLKLKEIFGCSRLLYRSFFSLLNLVSYGVPPTQEEIAKDPKCSICYENMRCPIKLLCNHIFCEECAEKWLDEKHTCPMCRAHVEEQDSSFFNASTCKTIRIY